MTDKDEAQKEYMKAYMKAYRAKNKYSPKRVHLTVSEADHRALKKRAKQEGKTVTKLTKELALISLYERDNFPSEVSEELKALSLILRGVATNINQMARHSNQLKQFSEHNELALKIRLLEDSVKDFLDSKQLRNHHDY